MRSRRILVVSLLFATGVACALAEDAPAIWIDVPFIAQTKNGCGSASIFMVLKYWEQHGGPAVPQPVDPRQIQERLFSSQLGGIPASSMEKYFRESGYRTFVFSGAWPDLKHHLDEGRPLIVSLKASGPHGPLHYAVVVGIDSQRGYLFLNDPAQSKMIRISREGFESEWSYTHNWTLLAVPRTDD